jgi:hypothetical protein
VSWYPHEVDVLILGVESVEGSAYLVHILGLGVRAVRDKAFKGTFAISEK